MQQVSSTADRRHVLADTVPAFAVRDVLLVVGFAALVGLLAQVVIPLPFTPVPITGQTFGVLLGGMALGWRRALIGMVVYVGLGLVGLHWFAGGKGGTGVIGGPSFGYLIGFIVAAAVLGRLAELRFDRDPLRVLGSMVVGNLIIYLFGVSWLMVAIHVDLAQGIALGLIPFLLGDAIKALLAAGLLPTAWKVSGR
ncbi:MAG TPA: biotin transporter BioY [Candidatus Dormibacteraeota bacterium]